MGRLVPTKNSTSFKGKYRILPDGFIMERATGNMVAMIVDPEILGEALDIRGHVQIDNFVIKYLGQ